jgi:hypothetical protein
MIIKKSKSGIIKMTAQGKGDSIKLLEIVEDMAGRGSDPDRASVKMRQEHEATLRQEDEQREARKKAYRDALFINQGSVWDIKIHLENSWGRYSIAQLAEEIEREKITRNRSTVIKMITGKMNKMAKIKPSKEVNP